MEIENLYSKYSLCSSVITDTRNIIPDSIFFALKGQNFNGNDFAYEALNSGARYAVVDEPQKIASDKFIFVNDVLSTLQMLANHHRRQLNIPFLAITGSNGKTTTKELIRNVLAKKFRTTATKGNLNNHIGIPLTLLSIPANAEFAVIEMGANHQHEIESYCKIVEPDFGLITNVGKAHLEGFGGFEGVKKGKGELYEFISRKGKSVFLNADNTHLNSMAELYKLNSVIKYGSHGENYCNGKLLSENPTLKVGWKCSENAGVITSNLIGAYNFENILSAICIGNYFQVDAGSITAAIEEYIPDNSRSQVIVKGTNTIILDAYNANPSSMDAALNNFSKINSNEKIVFLGEMAELGNDSEDEHQLLINHLQKINLNKIILVGNKFSKLKSQINCFHFADSTLAAEWLKNNPVTKANILIKGSRSTKMEKILEGFA